MHRRGVPDAVRALGGTAALASYAEVARDAGLVSAEVVAGCGGLVSIFELWG